MKPIPVISAAQMFLVTLDGAAWAQLNTARI